MCVYVIPTLITLLRCAHTRCCRISCREVSAAFNNTVILFELITPSLSASRARARARAAPPSARARAYCLRRPIRNSRAWRWRYVYARAHKWCSANMRVEECECAHASCAFIWTCYYEFVIIVRAPSTNFVRQQPYVCIEQPIAMGKRFWWGKWWMWLRRMCRM